MADSDQPRPRKRDRRDPPVPRTPDALDIALDRADDDDAASALLAKHTELLKEQIRTARLDHGAKRMAMAARFLIAFAAFAVAGGFIWMVLAAREEHGLVVEAFATPPDLAARGLSGEVLAANLADRLGEIDRAANSFRSSETMSVNWGDEVKIEIPSTGVSIGELDRFLRRKLGHETVIGGSVFRTPEGLRMTVRTGALGTVEQTGQDAQLEAMVRKAAEGVFAKTQPYRYSKYLEFSGRRDEAMAVARNLAATSNDPKERAWAWAQISNLYIRTDLVKAAEAGYQGIREDPDNALAYLNANIALSLLGRIGEARALSGKANALGVSGRGGLSEIGVNSSRTNSAIEPTIQGDYAESLRQLDLLSGTVYPGTEDLVPARRADALVSMHDISGSRRIADAKPDAYFAAHLENFGAFLSPQYKAAAALDDWAAAAQFARLQIAVLANAPEGAELARAGRERGVLPRLAIALSHQGQLVEARSIAAALPLDCYVCLMARVAVSGAEGDAVGARRWADMAKRLNPGTPSIGVELSRIDFRFGRYADALADAERAVALGPHFADALKARGDALRKLDRLDEAVTSYADAAQAAPRWGRLQIDWGFAEMRRGRWPEARRHFAAAGAMDLSAADRRLLSRLDQVAKGR
jgi:tetratricopeptide (TPR) repeat protein